ncbi:MAG: recombinase RecA [Clostridia bacterium]|nr:recombinase RecA [Clostridia bacterium]
MAKKASPAAEETVVSPEAEESKAAKKTAKKAVEPEVLSEAEAKKKALKTALAGIEKQFGKGAVIRMGDKPKTSIPVIPTGCMDIDMCLGVGGLPRGRVIEIYGPESSGKTTVALQTIAEAQRMGGVAAFVDAEHALDPIYARALGVDVDDLYVSQPDTGEQALQITEALVRSGAIDIIVIDSVAALVPKAEIDGEMGDSFVGLQARLMSQALRKLTGIVNKTNTVCIFINQLREKVGVMYGNPETTPGGRALKFYASVRIDVRKGEPIKEGSQVIGNRTKIKIVKNKVAPPFRNCEVDMLFGEGISKEGSLLDRAVDFDIIHKAGAWFSFNGDKIGQGRDNARQYLKSNPDFRSEVERLVRERIRAEAGAEEEPAAAENAAPLQPVDADLPDSPSELDMSDEELLDSLPELDYT